MQMKSRTFRKRFLSLLLVLMLLIGAFPIGASAEEISATTTAYVNLRAGRGTDTASSMVVPSGTTLTVTDTSDPNWYGVRLSDGKTGYIYSEYLNLASTPSAYANLDAPLLPGVTAYTVTSATLYKGKDASSMQLGVIGARVQLSVFDYDGSEFVGVELSGGNRGYVYRDTVFVQSSSGSTVAPNPTSAPAGSTSGEVAKAVTTVTVNVRSGKGTNTSVVDVIGEGTSVSVTDMSDSAWYGVRFSVGSTVKTGYIYSIYLDIVSYSSSGSTSVPTTTPVPTPAPTIPVGATPKPGESVVAEVNVDRLILRKGAGTTYGVIRELVYGTKVNILEKTSDQWYKVSVFNGTANASEGYVFAEYVTIVSGSLIPGTPVPTASPSPGTGVYGVTLVDLSLRSGPDITYSISDIVRRDTVVRILEQTNDQWYKVMLQDGQVGYFFASYLRIVSGDLSDLVPSDPNAPVPTATPTPGPVGTKTYVRVTGEGVNLRSSAGFSGSNVFRVVKAGTILEVIDKYNQDWVHVLTSDGKEGYISSQYVEDYEMNTSSAAVGTVNLAKYQTYYMEGSGVWSSDSNVVSVTAGPSNQVFLYAANIGTAKITLGDAVMDVVVTEPEAVRYAYTDPNIVSVNSDFELKAVTDAEKTAVRFDVMGYGSFETTTFTSETQGTNSIRVFSAPARVSAPGLYTVRAYSTSGVGYSTSYKEFTVLVVSTTGLTQTSNEERRASNEMLEILADFEGYVPSVEADRIVGVPTVGYGKVVPKNTRFYNNLTPTEAKAMLAETVNAGAYTTEVNRFVRNNGLLISQSQFDALVSFSYNVGATYWNDLSQACTVRDVILNAVEPPADLASNNRTASTTGAVTVLSTHGASGSRVTTFAANTPLYVRDSWSDPANTNNTWYYVSYGSTVGWVRSGYVRLTDTFAMRRDLNYVDAYTFGSELVKWHVAGGQCYIGLYYRRLAEAKIFSYANYAEARKTSPNYQKNTYGYEVPSCLA